MPEIITRSEAKALGLNKYFTGKPCKRDHITVRITCNGSCFLCHGEWRRNYMRKKYCESKEYRSQLLKRKREYRINHPELCKRADRIRWKVLNEDQEFKKKQRERHKIYYMIGPKNPIGEIGWLRKNKAQLRQVKRALRNLGASQSQSEA